MLSDAQIDVLRSLPALTHLVVRGAGTGSRALLHRLCRTPHTLRLRVLDIPQVQDHPLPLRGNELRALTTIPTLTALRPDELALEKRDLHLLTALPELRALRWQQNRDNPLLSVARSMKTIGALTQLTSLQFEDRRFGDKALARMLTPLTQLLELRLFPTATWSPAFLLSGTLPLTLRSLLLFTPASAASLAHYLPKLRSLTSLELFGEKLNKERREALQELHKQLRVPSALMPQLLSFKTGMEFPPRPNPLPPFYWD